MKNILLICSALFIVGLQNAQAQTPRSTYLYLEVNKNLPVQIKLNNRSIKNEHKGYVIIPRMNNGTNTLEFKFDNPNYKTHKFEIESNGKRSVGLKLMQVSNNKFVLQDVVNRRIISDNSTLNTPPIVASKKQPKTKKPIQEKKNSKRIQPKEGIVKVYKAKSKTDSRVSKEKKTRTVQTNVSNTSVKPRTYAMYRNRKPISEAKQRNRYKDYGKAKRAKRRAAKAAKHTTDPNTATQQAAKKKEYELQREKRKAEKLKAKEARRKELLEKEQAESLRLQKKRAEKNAKRLKEKEQAKAKKAALDKQKSREAKKLQKEILRKKLIEKEKSEKTRIAQEKKDRDNKRAERRRIAREKQAQKEADIKATKEMKLAKKKKAADAIIGEKIINAEPVAGQPIEAKKKNYEDPNEMRAIRCTRTVRTEKAADWTLKLHKKFDDEARMNYIRRKMGSQCISTNNLGVLLSNMETQIGRYKMIRSVYDQLEDQGNIDRLYKYFQSQSYVDKLKELRPSKY